MRGAGERRGGLPRPAPAPHPPGRAAGGGGGRHDADPGRRFSVPEPAERAALSRRVQPAARVAGSPEQDAYDLAKKTADAANGEVSEAEQEFGALRKELWGFLLDLVGCKQAEKCFKNADILACIETLATVIPWGKVLKVLKKMGK
ncbi:hypothetical protein [Actinomadura macrotermitis]|uniref:Uncharacterized protein n=1 Tax=Actinomadura macrotermitis TaxID=2585200 RepID=A0A7K0C3Q0_9ACTN|nr:hypothetical protein [Actinomadura macrotermitis]MQY08097.1 hypothetical protein [Actinomadura macrotermitis]